MEFLNKALRLLTRLVLTPVWVKTSLKSRFCLSSLSLWAGDFLTQKRNFLTQLMTAWRHAGSAGGLRSEALPVQESRRNIEQSAAGSTGSSRSREMARARREPQLSLSSLETADDEFLPEEATKLALIAHYLYRINVAQRASLSTAAHFVPWPNWCLFSERTASPAGGEKARRSESSFSVIKMPRLVPSLIISSIENYHPALKKLLKCEVLLVSFFFSQGK